MLATTIDGEVSLDHVDLAPATAWLFGPEAHGLPSELASAADHRVHIPMPGHFESLNIASAASICLYQSAARPPRLAPNGHLSHAFRDSGITSGHWADVAPN